MEKKYTASGVRNEASNHWRLSDGPQQTLAGKMLRAYADLLEAQEKAVPVMVVNHVSSAEHDLPIGMKLYAHPDPSDAERLAEALRKLLGEASEAHDQCWVDRDGEPHYANTEGFMKAQADARAALAAHPAPAQPPAASVTDALRIWANAEPSGDAMYDAARMHVKEMLAAQENPNG